MSKRVLAATLTFLTLTLVVSPLAGAKSNRAAKVCATAQQLLTELKSGTLSNASVGVLADAAKSLRRAKVNGASEQAISLSDAVTGSKKSQRKSLKQTVKWCKAKKVKPLTTTTTLPELQRAQNAYFIMTSEYNSVITTTNDNDALSVAEKCAAYAPAAEKWAQSLRDYPDWPENAQAAIDELVRLAAADAGENYACAKNGEDPISDTSDASARQASAVRLALQLPIDRS